MTLRPTRAHRHTQASTVVSGSGRLLCRPEHRRIRWEQREDAGAGHAGQPRDDLRGDIRRHIQAVKTMNGDGARQPRAVSFLNVYM